jgi:hypothetical protein
VKERRAVRDALPALLIFAAALAYLASLPRFLGVADESYFLYEAKRIRDGEVMYRDFFQFTTPLASYAMAGLYWAFGTSMSTARIGMAVVNAATAALLYVAARRLGVRSAIAAAVPLAQLALCFSTFPHASWHWFSTFWIAVVVVLTLDGAWAERPRRALAIGVAVGLLTGTQQQKGAAFAAGVALVFALDHVVDRIYGGAAPWRHLVLRLAYCGVGIALVIAPLLAGFAIVSGVEPLYAALVRFPLVNYRQVFSSTWGNLPDRIAGYGQYTLPLVLQWSRVTIALPAAQAVVEIARRRNRARARALSALSVLAVSSALSIAYYPDLIHVAFIAGAFWLCLAAGLEWMCAALPAPSALRWSGRLIGAAVCAGLLMHLVGYSRLLRAQFPLSYESAFGRVAFQAQWEVTFLKEAAKHLHAAHATKAYSYPSLSSVYLLLGVDNPTRYQYFDALVSPAQQQADVLATLERGDAPYVIMYWFPYVRPGDPIVRFIQQHYEEIPIPELQAVAPLPPVVLYARPHPAPADV